MSVKRKTADLTGRALDYAVGLLEKPGIASASPDKLLLMNGKPYSPSTDWAQGGPIIEREGISIAFGDTIGVNLWGAEIWPDYAKPCTARAQGPTALIAAMRCYVASKLGHEIDVPEELA